MEPEIIGVFIPIIAIIGIVIMIIYLRRYENIERMAMIEKGMSPADLKKPKEEGFTSLRFGLLLVGAGLGFLVGYFLDENTRMNEIAYFSMLFVFGGIGLLIAYFMQQKKLEKKEF